MSKTGKSAKIGVLALQGDFDAHRLRLEELGAEVVLVKKPEQLDDIDGLVIPGGESGTFLKLLGEAGFEVILDDRDERPGVKFKDADLLGVPIRVTVGALLGREGKVEVRTRRDRQDVTVAPDGVVATVRDLGRSLASEL